MLSPRGVYLVPGGVLSPRGCLAQGVSGPGGCLLQGALLQGDVCSRRVSAVGVSAPGGCGIPACTEADTPSVNRMTNRCKNITLTTTSLRPVIILFNWKSKDSD